MARSETFISHAEDIVEDVAKWGVEEINRIVDALAPDGRPFGMEKRSRREQVREYVETLRGNPEAWKNWVNERVNRIVTILTEAGVSQEDIASVHPYSIVESFAVAHSNRMERWLEKEEEKARESTLRPLPPADEGEEDDAGRDEPEED